MIPPCGHRDLPPPCNLRAPVNEQRDRRDNRDRQKRLHDQQRHHDDRGAQPRRDRQHLNGPPPRNAFATRRGSELDANRAAPRNHRGSLGSIAGLQVAGRPATAACAAP